MFISNLTLRVVIGVMKYKSNGYYVLLSNTYFLIKNDSFGVEFSCDFKSVTKHLGENNKRNIEFSLIGSCASSDSVAIIHKGDKLFISSLGTESTLIILVKDSSVVSFLVGEFSKLADYYSI